MARKVALPLTIALAILLYPILWSPFTLLVIDEATGAGVPSLRVTNDDGMVRYTGSHGELIIWNKSSHFDIRDEKNRFGTVTAFPHVVSGGLAIVKIRRHS